VSTPGFIRLQAEHVGKDAACRTYHRLEAQLAELDVDPEPETEEIVHTLLRRPRRPHPLVSDL